MQSDLYDQLLGKPRYKPEPRSFQREFLTLKWCGVWHMSQSRKQTKVQKALTNNLREKDSANYKSCRRRPRCLTMIRFSAHEGHNLITAEKERQQTLLSRSFFFLVCLFFPSGDITRCAWRRSRQSPHERFPDGGSTLLIHQDLEFSYLWSC